MWIKNIKLWNIFISNFDKDQLILIKGGLDRNFIKQIYLNSFNISNYNKIYPIFQFSRSYFKLMRITIKNITNS